jgi:hypothetical protein
MLSGKNDYRREELVLRVQSRRASMVEAATSTVVGLIVALLMNVWLLRYHYTDDPRNHIVGITTWMTFVSVIRGYVLRRLFNTEFWRHWKRERVVTECSDRHRSIAHISGDLSGLTREQKRKFNPRLLSLLDKEIERVMYGK